MLIPSTTQISRTNRALSIYLQTDKPIYKPGDNILLQLLFVNPVSHTIECEESAFPPSDSPLKLHLKIVDGKDSTIYEDENLEFQPEKKRMVFVSKWNIPNTQTGGIYRAIFSIIDHEDEICPSAERLFRIRQYFKQTNQVQVELDKESYFPRDIVNVKVFIKKGDGSPLSPDTQIFFTARVYIYIIYIYIYIIYYVDWRNRDKRRNQRLHSGYPSRKSVFKFRNTINSE